MLAPVCAAVFLLVSPILYYLLGLTVLQTLRRISRKWHSSALPEPVLVELLPHPATLVLGLLLHCTVAFYLKILGLNWGLSLLIPFLPLIFCRVSLRDIYSSISWRPELNFLVWFTIILAIGLSIMTISNTGIHTAWVNNYGDLPFHLGIISNFLFGENFPPEYQIFAGQRLSYPFMINFWSALLWSIWPDWKFLPLVFLYQWSLIWFCIYFLLQGSRQIVLPWAILLGGGSYFIMHSYSWELISKNYYWTVFISSIWIPQRSASFGVLCSLAALSCWYARKNNDRSLTTFMIGLLLGLGLLVHGHIVMATLLFIGAQASWEAAWPAAGMTRRSQVNNLIFLILGGLSAFSSLYWISGKSALLKWSPGWAYDKALVSTTAKLGQTAIFWLESAWPVLILLLPLFFKRSLWKAYLTLAGLFIFFNCVHLAQWDWDQLKVFIGLYCILIFLSTQLDGKKVYILQVLYLVLLIPALYECCKLFKDGPDSTVYSQVEMRQAMEVRERSPENAIFIAEPRHNSVVTLAGRKLYYGYEGTLWSHNLDYAARKERFADLNRLADCSGPECPTYLLWTDPEKKRWKLPYPPATYYHSIHQDRIFQIIRSDASKNKN